MQKNTKTYILLALVFSVWALVGYRIYSGVGSSNNSEVVTPITRFTPRATVKIDTFSIDLPKRDPFLGTISKVSNKKKLKKKIKPKIVKDTIFPNISYHGLVKKQNSLQEQVFVITIDGKQHLLKKGQRVDEVSLTFGNSKQVIVKSKGRTKTIEIK